MSDEHLDLELVRAIREEANSVPLHLDGDQLRERLARGTQHRQWAAVWRLAAVFALVIAVAGVVVAMPRLGGWLAPAATPGCDVSEPIRYEGSWWHEIGGPDAFFDGQHRHGPATGDRSYRLVIVRFEPAPESADQLAMWAEPIGGGERVAGVLNSTVDPANLYRFDEPAPPLDGGWYLFQQELPHPGCWRLSAAVDGQVVGSATIDVGPAPPPHAPDPDAPTPGLPPSGTCEVTQPVSVGEIPPRVAEFMNNAREVAPGLTPPPLSMVGNEVIWTAIPADGRLEVQTAPDGRLWERFATYRLVEGNPDVTARSLDDPPQSVTGELTLAETTKGFVFAVIGFPRPGCWEISYELAGEQLTFVLEVVAASDQAIVTPGPEPTPAATKDPSEEWDAILHRQAQDALARWAELVADAQPGAVVFVGELTRGGGWRGPDADDQKGAFEAGLIEATIELPTEPPPPGEVVWLDGSTATVSLFSAAEAIADLVREKADGSCADCRPLRVIGAELIVGEAETSRGLAMVPRWHFIFASADEPMVPITHVAVRDRIIAGPEQPWDPYGPNPIGTPIEAAYGSPDATELTVGFVGSPWTGDQPCGADYTAEAVESELAVVVIVHGHSRVPPDGRGCRLVGATRTAVATLAAPLGDRTVLEVQFGTPVALRSETPPADATRD